MKKAIAVVLTLSCSAFAGDVPTSTPPLVPALKELEPGLVPVAEEPPLAARPWVWVVAGGVTVHVAVAIAILSVVLKNDRPIPAGTPR